MVCGESEAITPTWLAVEGGAITPLWYAHLGCRLILAMSSHRFFKFLRVTVELVAFVVVAVMAFALAYSFHARAPLPSGRHWLPGVRAVLRGQAHLGGHVAGVYRSERASSSPTACAPRSVSRASLGAITGPLPRLNMRHRGLSVRVVSACARAQARSEALPQWVSHDDTHPELASKLRSLGFLSSCCAARSEWHRASWRLALSIRSVLIDSMVDLNFVLVFVAQGWPFYARSI